MIQSRSSDLRDIGMEQKPQNNKNKDIWVNKSFQEPQKVADKRPYGDAVTENAIIKIELCTADPNLDYF